jgi:cytochrome c-type protein NapB
MNTETRTPSEHHTAADLMPPRLRRFIPLFGVVGITLAVVGFVSGLREPGRVARPAPAERFQAVAPAAVGYAELPTSPLGPNANWRQSLADLKYDKPGIFDPVVRTPEQTQAALADRARNRAYDGAPPTIPHPVSTHSANGCLACHGEGLKVGDRVASKMSHAMMTNCTQCHVEQTPQPVSAATTFAGLSRSGPGERASPGAPPTIPHHTWMRENCTSCHGLVARPGLRTTHPWLTNCTQCHAPSASLDQRLPPEGGR